MLTMALEANAPQHNHLVITFDFLPLERADHARWSFNQAFSLRLITAYRIIVRNAASISARLDRSISRQTGRPPAGARTFELIFMISPRRNPEGIRGVLFYRRRLDEQW